MEEERPAARAGSGGGSTRELGGAGREAGGGGGRGREGRGGGGGGNDVEGREGGGTAITGRDGGGMEGPGRDGAGGAMGAAPEMFRPCASAGARVEAGGTGVRVSFAGCCASALGTLTPTGAGVAPRTDGRGGG